jgi:hypothetical protein
MLKDVKGSIISSNPASAAAMMSLEPDLGKTSFIENARPV